MSVIKTQGSFPVDDDDRRRRQGPAGNEPSDVSAQSAEAANTSAAAPLEPQEPLTGLPDLFASAGRVAGRIIEAVAGSPPPPRPVAGPAQTGTGDVPVPGRPPTTGVIFVHGIGSQKPGETLLQWSTPIIEVLTGWKQWAAPGSTVHDPVETARIDFQGDRPTIDLIIPAATVGGRAFPAARWILTESWWAAKVAPPRLSTMTSWLGPQNGAGQIVSAVLGNRAGSQLAMFLPRAAVIPFVSVLAALILSVYALIRGVTGLIPIQSVKDAAILRSFDEFLTGWFGDIRILLFDPVQSANIRSGLAASIRRLRDEDHVDSVVVVAHSGGAMVSYLTLTDPVHGDLGVDKLITFGEGWNLAMTLTPEGRGMADRLRRDITGVNQELRWRDYWASHDPAPAGEVRFPEIGQKGASDPKRIRSRMVWNRRSLLDDHGTYFENDEEFTLSVLREIDAPGSWGETRDGESPVSRFYPTPVGNDDQTIPPVDKRERRHRERVAVLALWRQLAIAIPIAVITAVLASPTRLTEIGQLAVAPLQSIPVVVDVGAFVINWLRSLEPPAIQIGPIDLPTAVSVLGLATLQAIVIVSILQLLGAPVTAYQAWPIGSSRRRLFQVVEVAIAAILVVATVYLLVAPDHNTLLGAGQSWINGWLLTAATVGLAVLGSLLARAAPATTRLFAIVATTIFIAAMASAVMVIFERKNLEVGELGYAVIWLAFIALYKVGFGRWDQWDRVERRAAYAESDEETRSRLPVWMSMAGFLLVGVAFVVLFLNWSATFAGWPAAAWIGGAGVVIVIAAIGLGSQVWGDTENAISSPGAVDSARGRV
jgi:pimeloyl-ACP methyl ester carboxylesterase